jgi:hypothetical protein
MRTTLTPILLLLLSAPMHAQLSAGEVPDGSIAYEVNIDLFLDQAFTSDTADLELDCDDFMDARAMLFRGAPEIDAPHVASLQFVDDDIEVCMDMSPSTNFQLRPKYYAFGEVLDCSGDFDWQVADQLVLGDIGGFMAIGPWVMDSMYIAYRRGNEMGWILLSFDLTGNDGSRLQVHRLLPICQGPNAVAENERPSLLSLYPNPGNGGTIRVESANDLRQLELLDSSGRMIARYSGNVQMIAAPEIAGSYLVRATFTDGQRSVSRFVRQ